MPALLISRGAFAFPHAKSLLLAIAIIAAFLVPRLGESFFRKIERFLGYIGAHKRLSILGIIAGVIFVRLSLLPILPVPVPEAQDEFGYLLSADTFAHGRLTNPPHPLWIFFDTFQVNQQPTYMSRYPPAQGAVLAVGQLMGHPWIGVLLSVAAMCGAVLWALQGWLPASWALLGTILIAARIGTFGYWMNSYWGGAVAATGGALVIGALPRILRQQRSIDAWLLGSGAAILVNSRPVEGVIFCVPVFAVLAAWMIRARSVSSTGDVSPIRVSRIIIPIAVCVIMTCAFTAYYNWRVTGSAFLPPFALNQRLYFRGQPVFLWQKKLPATRTMNPQFDSYYNIFPGGFDGTWRGVLYVTWRKFVKFRDFFLFTESALLIPLVALPWILRKGRSRWLVAHMCACGFILLMVAWKAPAYAVPVASTLPVSGLLWLLRDKEVRFLVIEWIVCFAGMLAVIAFLEHYAAPLLAVFFILVMQSLRYLRRWSHGGKPVGVALSRVVVLFVIGMFPVLVAQDTLHPNSVPPVAPAWSLERASIEAQLEKTPGQHLVIVRYSPDHHYETEVVYNLADIDHEKVIWARELPNVDIQPLLDYFAERRVWLLQPDISPQLTPYPRAAAK